MIYWQLFVSFFQVGLFSIGGGLAALPLIQNQVVQLHHWLTLSEFTDLVTIAEMTPGPIALNSSTFVGIQVGGFPGALIATFGCILPSCIIVSILAYVYQKYKDMSAIQGVLAGLRPAVIALISSAAVAILQLALFGEHVSKFDMSTLNVIGTSLFVGALFVLRKFKINPILVMTVCGFIGGFLYY